MAPIWTLDCGVPDLLDGAVLLHALREAAPVIEAIRVLVADGQPAARAGVRAALAGHDLDVVAEASDALQAVEIALRERPDVCLIDVDLPGGGISVAASISAKLPQTAIVMFAEVASDDDLFDGLRAGASGYLVKDIDPTRLPYALLGVLEGEAPIPRRLVTRLVEEFRERGQRRRVSVAGRRAVELTSREAEVLDLLQQDLTTAAIAKRLFISKVTVRTHVSAIVKKLGVESRDEALRLVRGS